MTASDAKIYKQLAFVCRNDEEHFQGSIKHIPYFKANYIKIFSEKLCLFVFFRLSGLNSFAKVNFHSASPR